MTGELINFEVQRILSRNARFLVETVKEAREEMDDILAMDITKLDGRQLRKLRDHLIWLQRVVAAGSPETYERVALKHEELGRELTDEEAAECMGPIRAIKFSLA